MIIDALLATLGAYSLQIACIVLAGAVLPLIVRVSASLHHAWWRCLLVAALTLPWLLHGVRPVTRGDIREVSTFASAADGVEATRAAATWIDAAVPWGVALAAIFVAGVLLHLAWIAAGLLRLRRLSGAGDPVELSEDQVWLQQLLGTRAIIRYVGTLDHPVTFGLRFPIVLLPLAIRQQPAAIQRAVLCHELVHVQRRDWGWLIVEECLRSAFWFHPVVRWLLTRVQLTREEVVDEIAVAACGGDRRAYIQALMTFADDTRLTPAAAFSRRRHLYRRIVQLTKETVMSFRRIAIFGSVSMVLVAGTSWLGAEAFPTALLSASQLGDAAGPLERAASPVTDENPVPTLRLSTTPLYPAEARAAGVNANIGLRVTLDQFGRVAEMRRGNFIVRRPVMMAMTLDQGPAFGQSQIPGEQLRDTAGRLAQLSSVRSAVEAMFQSTADAVSHWQYDAPNQAPLSFTLRFDFRAEEPEGRILLPADMIPSTNLIRSSRGSENTASGSQTSQGAWTAGTRVQGAQLQFGSGSPLRVGGGVAAPVRLTHVPPVYPQEAQAARIQGVVIIEATVGPDGRVADARILRSVPLLDAAALEAVRQWEYQPTLLNGVPVPVIMTVTVQFSLPD